MTDSGWHIEQIPTEKDLTTWERWKTTPKGIYRAIRFYKWLKSPGNQKRKFSYSEVRQILIQHNIFKRQRLKQEEMLYRDSLIGMSLKEIAKKYMTTEQRAQNAIDRRARHFSPQVYEMTEDFIKARLNQLALDSDDARRVMLTAVESLKNEKWVDDEQTETSGGKFDGEIRTKRVSAIKRQIELINQSLKQQLLIFEAIGQFVPKTNILINEGKDLASLPHDQLIALIKQKEKELRIPSESRVVADVEQTTG